jgi:peptidoglycan/LPS O-acetylase OafA/YrhL
MGVLRLFLALSVLLGHTRGHGFLGLSFVFPEIAVQSFFIISGFYMALILNEKYNQPGQYTTFLQQRFLRLYPTYFILIVSVVVVDLIVQACIGRPWGSLANFADHFHLFSPLGLAVLVIENLIIFGQDVVMLSMLDPNTGALHYFWHNDTAPPVSCAAFLLIGSSWSLAVEFTFYLVAPFLVRRPVRAQLVIVALCFLVRAAMYWFIPDDSTHWIYFLFPANLYLFMTGSLAYIIYKKFPAQLTSLGRNHWWLIVLFAVLGLDYCRYPDTRQLYLIWLPAVVFMVPLLFTLTCRSRVDRLIGELSYPVYLIHPHVLKFTIPLLADKHWQWALGPLSFAITLVLSWLFYRFVETKTERFRENLYKKSRPRSAGPQPDAVAGLQTTAPRVN